MSEGRPGGRVYVYGVVGAAADQPVCTGVAGLDGTSPVGIVAQGGIGCVISAYHGEDLRFVPRETLLRYLLRHQQVVEQVMQHLTILPVKFGTLLNDRHEVLDMLSQGRGEFLTALAAIQDKVEIEVAATWDTGSVLRVLATDGEVVRAREAVAAKRRGDSRIAPTLEDQLRLGQLVKARMDLRRDSYRGRMVSYLKPLAMDIASNPLVSEEMVMNVAFLVERARQGEFDERVRSLDSHFDSQVTFRVIGPLPPYSFSTVQVTRLREDQVEQARQELELPNVLPNVLGEAEVRRAYRRLAAREQQKARLGARPAGGRLARLQKASEVLLALPRGRTLPGEFSETRATDCVFAIAVRGTGYQEIDAARFGAAVGV